MNAPTRSPKAASASIAVSILSPEEVRESIPGLAAGLKEPRLSSKPSQEQVRLPVSPATGRRNRSLP